MTVHGVGACMLLSFMRLERRADFDNSWMLHGPGMDEPKAQTELPPVLRWAAE